MTFPGKIIQVVGNSGVGKTTLVQALQHRGRFHLGLESHADRPFQARLASGKRQFALANQLDYLILRAEQEWNLRSQPGTGLMDGGLDMDFRVFTRHFYRQGWMDEDEFELCGRFYRLARRLLPAPELTVFLIGPPILAMERLQARRRPVEVAKAADLAALDTLLKEWMAEIPDTASLNLDASLPVDALVEQVCSAAALRWVAVC